MILCSSSPACTYVLHLYCAHHKSVKVNTSNSEQRIRHFTLLIIVYCYHINLEPTDILLRVQCLIERELPRVLKLKQQGHDATRSTE